MPKVSYGLDAFYEPKLGFTEGYAEITGAVTKIVQYSPNKETGEEYPPFMGAVLTFQPTTEAGVPTSDPALERTFRIEKDKDKMRPGNAQSADDPDPVDLGAEVDTEGNAIFTEKDARINVNSGWAIFVKSLAACGFDPGILNNSYLPDLIGTKGHFTTVKQEKRNIGGRDVEPAMLIADKITVKPYEKAAKKSALKSNGVDKTPTKLAAVPKPAPASAPATATAQAPETANVASTANPSTASASTSAPANVPEEVETPATVILAELSGELSGQTRHKQNVYGLSYSRLLKDRNRDKKIDKAIQDLWHDDAWLASKGEDLGYVYADGVFNFGGVIVPA